MIKDSINALYVYPSLRSIDIFRNDNKDENARENFTKSQIRQGAVAGKE